MKQTRKLIIDAAIKKGQLILQKADEKAEAIIADAKLKAASEAEKIIEARVKAEEEDGQLMINSAIQKGQTILQGADARAEAVIAEAKQKAASEAERILADARQEAEKESLNIISEAKNRADKLTLIITQEALQLEHATAGILTAESPVSRVPVFAGTDRVTSVTQAIKGQTLGGRGEYIVNAPAVNYQGIVELVVLPPVSTRQVFTFLMSLRKVPGVKVLHFKERPSGGFTVRLRLQTAIPLLNILTTAPGVKKASASPVAAANRDAAQQKGTEQHQDIITVMLKS